MERLLEFDAESGDLQIRFPYAKELVAVVRGLPGRRWNPTEKLWTVPTQDEVVEFVRVYDPGLVGFSVMTQQFEWACRMAEARPMMAASMLFMS